jgi:hypothetical protein
MSRAFFLKCTIDDLPMVKASALRAWLHCGTKTTLIRFDDSGVSAGSA